MKPARFVGFLLLIIVALVAAACGAATPTATATTPKATTASTPTTPPVAPTTAATQPAPGQPTPAATTAPAPTATPAPTSAVATPVIHEGRRGGALQLRSLPGYPVAYDTYNVRSWLEYILFGPMLNNLIWVDPYGDQMSGDAASTWEFSANGTVITFKLKQNVVFHDGTRFSAKDALYNIDRAIHPRDAQMTFFKTRFEALQKVEAADDYTVKLTLNTPSNIFFRGLAMSGFLMYPAHLPFPEKFEDWRKSPIGTGPFKLRAIDPNIKVEYVRNDQYFKPGLPYLDSINITSMENAVATAAFRTGRIDASNIDNSATANFIDELRRAQGYTPVKATAGLVFMHFNQRGPLTDPRVREALNLATDRQSIIRTWLDGRHGFAPVGPLLPPEVGGLWGIPAKELETMPGFREDKTADLARAKALLAEAGIDPSRHTLSILISDTITQLGQSFEPFPRELGFKVTLESRSPAEVSARYLRGDFDITLQSSVVTFDDPADYIAPLVLTAGALNFGRWSNPRLDALVAEQDRTLDVSKRKELLLAFQRMVLEDKATLPLVIRYGYHGYMPWTKNFPTNAPFLHDNIFRWEQVWLQR